MADTKNEITRIAAYALLANAGRILLCRISDQLPEHAGFWTLPGGGLEFGEHPADAMVREVREETGLIVQPAGIAGVDSLVVKREPATYHSVRILYFAEIVGGKLSNERDGTTDLCDWQTIAEIGSLPVVDLVEVGLGLVSAARSSAAPPE